jgi:hypothetical protein
LIEEKGVACMKNCYTQTQKKRFQKVSKKLMSFL